jgi:hypothetical protein
MDMKQADEYKSERNSKPVNKKDKLFRSFFVISVIFMVLRAINLTSL